MSDTLKNKRQSDLLWNQNTDSRLQPDAALKRLINRERKSQSFSIISLHPWMNLGGRTSTNMHVTNYWDFPYLSLPLLLRLFSTQWSISPPSPPRMLWQILHLPSAVQVSYLLQVLLYYAMAEPMAAWKCHVEIGVNQHCLEEPEGADTCWSWATCLQKGLAGKTGPGFEFRVSESVNFPKISVT